MEWVADMGLWRHFCWSAWRDQPGRVLLAIVAVMLGVALAFGVVFGAGGAATRESERPKEKKIACKQRHYILIWP